MSDDSVSRELQDVLKRINGRDPRMAQWECEDGWIVGYTLERFGTHAAPLDSAEGPCGTGKFGFFVYKPVEVKDDIVTYELVRHRYLNRRKDAKRLASNEYWKRCPAKRAKQEAKGFRWDNQDGWVKTDVAL